MMRGMDIEKLSEHFGGDYELSKALGVTQGAISQWRGAGQIPILRQYQIQVLTMGRFRVTPKRREDAAA